MGDTSKGVANKKYKQIYNKKRIVQYLVRPLEWRTIKQPFRKRAVAGLAGLGKKFKQAASFFYAFSMSELKQIEMCQGCICTALQCTDSESVLEFLNTLWGLGTQLEQGCRTGPTGYAAWRNWFLGIDCWAP